MKSETPSFVLELPLNTNPMQESTILIRLEAGRQLYNACLGEALKRLDLLRQSKEFQETRKLPRGKARTRAFKDLNKKFEFTQYDFHHYAVGIRHGWIEEHINVHIAEKIAARAFKAVQKKAFRKAKNIRFKGKNQFDTLEGQSNKTGLIFENNVLRWAGLEIPCIIDKENELISYGLQHRVKYCRLVRRKINGKNRFYVQLILEGKPYQDPEKEFGKEELGMDVGPSTYAIAGDTKAELKQFCDELVPKWKEKRRLQRKLDRQKRANNPQNFNENGTVKKGKKKWKQSNHYKRSKSEIAELERKTAAHRKSLHGHEQNIILAQGTVIKAEKVSIRAWQKIFGKSVSIRAPSMFMSGLKRKAENAGGHFYDFPTNTTRLSQICHICGEAVKKPLSQRWHTCCGIDMQRDLYSAFLAKCVDVNTCSLDIARARMLWQGLEPVLREAVSRVIQSANGGKIFPSSFGVGRRQSGSPVKPEETVTEAADDVVRGTSYEDESRREVT
ncbi:MAG: hypothetical protein EPN24_04435 [Candidatus Methanoperedens sp.]|nr:MAG: hypothetical protein EPN24_04435 [Candidatus Methanoperedens sp.]